MFEAELIIPFYTILSIVIGCLAGLYPLFFLSVYIFFYNFFYLGGNKVSSFGFEFTTYKLLCSCILIFFSFCILKWRKSIYLRDLLDKNLILPLSMYLGAMLFTGLVHKLYWNEWPQGFMLDSIKCLWPLCFLLIPIKIWSTKKVLKYGSLSCLLILLLLTPSTLWIGLKYGVEFLRGSDQDFVNKAAGYFGYNGEIFRILSWKEKTQLTWAIFLTPGFHLFIPPSKQESLWEKFAGYFLIFSLVLILWNKVFKIILLQTIQFTLTIFQKVSSKNLAKVLAILFMLTIVFLFQWNFYAPKLQMKKIETEKDLMQASRLSLVLRTFEYAKKEGGWRGLGYRRDDGTLPSQKDITYLSGHSKMLDDYFFFGFPLSLLASFILFFPILVFLFIRSTLINSSFYHCLLTMSLLFIPAGALGMYGMDVSIRVLIIFFVVILMNEYRQCKNFT